MASKSTHVLLVTFPAQGHINPTLHFANRLVSMGIDVTFSTSIYALRRMSIAKTANEQARGGLTFTGFSDGFDDGFSIGVDDAKHYMSEIKARGSEALRETIVNSAEQGRPVTCLVYTLLLPWAAQVAQESNIPSALLWIQPATVLDVYYWYFHGFKDEIESSTDSGKITLPGVVELSRNDLPSFLLPSTSDMYVPALALFDEQLQILDGVVSKPKVLVNTFDALEIDALKAIEGYDLIGVGPLIPPAFVGGSADLKGKSFGGDLFSESVDYIDWLESNDEASVVYVSFGNLLKLEKAQLEEIAKGLLECGRPFLWVIRENNSLNDDGQEKLSCIGELEKLGRIVPWCSQLEVLTHPSLGCFVTHCGWNSTLESISCGVPVVAFPHWTDQGTNAKLIEDVWRTGVRVRANEEKGVVESCEIRRCIEEVMDSNGTKAKELRENAMKWKHLAREALQENGSSYVNLKAFFDKVDA